MVVFEHFVTIIIPCFPILIPLFEKCIATIASFLDRYKKPESKYPVTFPDNGMAQAVNLCYGQRNMHSKGGLKWT